MRCCNAKEGRDWSRALPAMTRFEQIAPPSAGSGDHHGRRWPRRTNFRNFRKRSANQGGVDVLAEAGTLRRLDDLQCSRLCTGGSHGDAPRLAAKVYISDTLDIVKLNYRPTRGDSYCAPYRAETPRAVPAMLAVALNPSSWSCRLHHLYSAACSRVLGGLQPWFV